MSIYKKAYSSKNSFRRKVFRRFFPHFARESFQRLRGKGIYKNYYDENKCIFIHIPKNAGQAVSDSLFSDRYPGHWTYLEYEWENRDKAKTYFKFCVIRNPYERILSAYNYLKGDTCTKLDKYFADNYLTGYDDFGDFIRNGLHKSEIKNWIHFKTQTSFICGNDGELKADFICRLETLSDDFNILKSKLGMDEKSLGHINKSKGVNLEKYYTDELKSIVFEAYKCDFIRLGYCK